MKVSRGFIALGLALLSAGCSYGHGVQDPFDAATRQSTSLTVDNDHPVDVRVAMLRGHIALPIGRVGGSSARTLRLGLGQISEVGMVQFEIRESLNSRTRLITPPVLAGPGHPIRLRIGSGLQQSTVTVQ